MNRDKCIPFCTPNIDRLIGKLLQTFGVVPALINLKNFRGTEYERKLRFYNWIQSEGNNCFNLRWREAFDCFYDSENGEAVPLIKDILKRKNPDNAENIERAYRDAKESPGSFQEGEDCVDGMFGFDDNPFKEACDEARACVHNIEQFKDKLETFLETGTTGSILQKEKKEGKTILHLVAEQFHHDQSLTENQVKCLSIVLDKAEELGRKVELLDELSSSGETALHLAVKNQATRVSIELIRHGASMHIENNAKRKRTPLDIIYETNFNVPKVLKVLTFILDRNIEVWRQHPSDDFTVHLDFQNIIAPTYPSENVCQTDSEADRLIYNRKSQKFLPQMAKLAQLITMPSETYEPIFRHPLVILFLELKWRKMRLPMNIYSAIQIIFYLIPMFFLLSLFPTDNSHSSSKENIAENMMFEYTGLAYCYISSIAFCFILTLVKVIIETTGHYKFAKGKKYYPTFRFGLFLQWLFLIVYALTFVTTPSVQRGLALIGVLLCGILITVAIGNSNWGGIIHSEYVYVYQVIFRRFFTVIATFSALILALAISLSILSTIGTNPSKPFISWLAKAFMMLVGELNFENDFRNDPELFSLANAALFLYVLVGAIGTIILMDLFVGYTVHDIQTVKLNADVIRRRHQVEQLFSMEVLFLLLSKVCDRGTFDDYMVPHKRVCCLNQCPITSELKQELSEILMSREDVDT